MKPPATTCARRLELLAPAGGPAAGYAALQYGADAVYLGLARFSARAEAENFTRDQLANLAGYAHALSPRRRVYVALNTLVLQGELDELVDHLGALAEIGVDALIVQDLGVARLARRHFPALRLHASTQLAIHNPSGLAAARALGFTRATLARELSLPEIVACATAPDMESEVFVHGALCFGYSGLCLLSSHLLGRSGNRGCCAYLCREQFAPPPAAGAPSAGGFVFAMKDLALAEALPALRRAGVAALKIEGRMKSALYVAATVDYYRRLLDGNLPPSAARALAADLRTIFSRPWTGLGLMGADRRPAVESGWTGHRGVPIGRVAAVVRTRSGGRRLRFRTDRALEKHDGLQVDVPGQPRPYGFALDWFRVVKSPAPADPADPEWRYHVPAGAVLEAALPPDHPALPVGAAVYCASSQAVKRRYRFPRPRPGEFQVRPRVDFTIACQPSGLTVAASLAQSRAPAVTMSLPGPFPPADHPLQMEQACREAFGRLGASPFAAGEIAFDGAAAGFVPVSRLNTFRRELLDQLARQWEQAARDRLAPIKAAAATPARAPPAAHPPFRWLLKTDQPGVPDDFEGEDWTDCDEVILEITPAVARQFPRVLDRLAGRVGRDRIRLALPVILRQRETDALRRPVAECLAGGWTRWQTANLGGWTWLREQAPAGAALDWSADWPLYALNWPAAQSLLDLGAESLTLSPEDGLENWRQLLPALGPRAVVIVYQDTPLMISAHAAAVSAPGAGPSALRSAAGDELAVISGRPAVVINRRPLCLAEHLPALAQAGAGRLRADFICRPYAAAEARAVWRRLRSGQGVPGTHAANFSRGLA